MLGFILLFFLGNWASSYLTRSWANQVATILFHREVVLLISQVFLFRGIEGREVVIVIDIWIDEAWSIVALLLR